MRAAVLRQHLGKVDGGGQGSKIDLQEASGSFRELQEVGLHPGKDIEHRRLRRKRRRRGPKLFEGTHIELSRGQSNSLGVLEALRQHIHLRLQGSTGLSLRIHLLVKVSGRLNSF